ncbi:MAG: U32 family peptidase [Spirochaetales bacterium]|nr:U32 family peptidase [Spirochaetales bacterium]
MEIVSPAGNREKLHYAYLFGADAAYIGIKNFSLRAKADNFNFEDHEIIKKTKPPGKKLYCACNIYFHDNDLRHLEENLEKIAAYPFDAFIISDLGALSVIKRYFPGKPLHLSTQANCINSEAAKMYRDMGFSRLILGREVNLKEIEEIRTKAGIGVEVFVHGAMCLAYSGRCFLSAYMANRSANKGDCAHACRWKYRVLEEEERTGEYFPIYEGDDYTVILSSKDLCMIDHLGELRNAGVTAIKIEGRMKSVYYVAIATRAYRKVLDSLEGMEIPGLADYKTELFKVSQREFSTGFFFDKADIETSTQTSYYRPYEFLGFIGKQVEPGLYELVVKYQIRAEDTIEYVGYDILFLQDSSFVLLDEEKKRVEKADHGKIYFIRTEAAIKEGYLIRRQKS